MAKPVLTKFHQAFFDKDRIINKLAANSQMTTEELLNMPDDGVERWLIRGQLREKPASRRDRWHSRISARLSQLIGNWLDEQPEPRGEVYDGEAGCRLRRDLDTTVGIDVVYVSPEVAAEEPDNTSLIEGVPLLVVEVLSPNDTQEEINEKIDDYLDAGVSLVWIVDPHDRTVTVYQNDAEPALFNIKQEISADPHLPGFRIAVAKIFGR